ncbi:MAG: hypothetical protein ACK53Y_03170, partial [bacterium]
EKATCRGPHGRASRSQEFVVARDASRPLVPIELLASRHLSRPRLQPGIRSAKPPLLLETRMREQRSETEKKSSRYPSSKSIAANQLAIQRRTHRQQEIPGT